MQTIFAVLALAAVASAHVAFTNTLGYPQTVYTVPTKVVSPVAPVAPVVKVPQVQYQYQYVQSKVPAVYPYVYSPVQQKVVYPYTTGYNYGTYTPSYYTSPYVYSV